MTSKIKVDNINKVSDDTNIIKKCGSTTTVGSGSGNTIVVCGSTVTIGRCGGTVALASGSTQTGFGREGSVNWQTGSLKTSTFTAVSGEGYFINSGSAITMNLPAGSAGAIVAVSDYARNFSTYNLTITANGSEKIGGVADDATLNIDGQAATFVYVDSTKGWINVQNAEDTETGVTPAFVAASGGTETTSGDFKIHTFTGPGTFTVSCAGNVAGSDSVDYFVVAGGGSGGGANGGGGGGGAGGFRLSNSTSMPAPLTSPLANPTGLSLPAAAYPITIGAGGASVTGPGPSPGSVRGNDGSNSIFSTITSTGGGAGGGAGSSGNGGPGGSGGGEGGQNSSGGPGNGNTPPVIPSQGNNGGDTNPGIETNQGSGGGGAGAAGSGNGPPTSKAGDGGIGSFVLATGFAGSNGTTGPVSSTRYFAGGGGGNSESHPASCQGAGGAGGGGAGGISGSSATAGGTNTGGGGGGIDASPAGQSSGAGGSGIVILRYKFQ